MTHKFAAALCLLTVLFVLTACTTDATPATQASAPLPTATNATPPTPAPTPTPVTRPTLPPTWTPEVTETVAPSATPDTRFVELRLSLPAPDVCAKFGPVAERNPTVVPPNTPVQIYWSSAKNARLYEITVYDVNNTALAVLRTQETTILLRAALFTGFDQPYAWQVVPYGNDGKPLCFPRGSDFRTAAR